MEDLRKLAEDNDIIGIQLCVRDVEVEIYTEEIIDHIQAVCERVAKLKRNPPTTVFEVRYFE